MRSTDDIINKEFSHSFLGYDMREVDFFLDELIERFEKLEAERREMLSAMEYLLKRVEALGGDDNNGDGRRLAAAGSTLQRLKGASTPGISTAPVRVQPGGNLSGERREVKKRSKLASRPEPDAEPEPEDVPVAIEVETEDYAPDLDQLMPELLNDVEAVMDAGLRRTTESDRDAEETAIKRRNNPE